MNRTHKKCRDCKNTKPVSEFYSSTRSNGRTYYASYCKSCSVTRSRSNEVTTREGNFTRLWEYFKTHRCVDCDEGNPLKLSLDHRDEKNYDIANMMRMKWHRISKELRLCDVRCHNCHAVRTAAQFNHFTTKSLRDYVTKWPENKKAYKETTK